MRFGGAQGTVTRTARKKKGGGITRRPCSDTLSNVRPVCTGKLVAFSRGSIAALAGQLRIAGVGQLCFALYHIRNRIDCNPIDADFIMEVRAG